MDVMWWRTNCWMQFGVSSVWSTQEPWNVQQQWQLILVRSRNPSVNSTTPNNYSPLLPQWRGPLCVSWEKKTLVKHALMTEKMWKISNVPVGDGKERRRLQVPPLECNNRLLMSERGVLCKAVRPPFHWTLAQSWSSDKRFVTCSVWTPLFDGSEGELCA